MKISYIQYAGDFSEAYERLVVRNGRENYYGQKYSVEYVVKQARLGHDVTIIVLHGQSAPLTILERNLSATNYGGQDIYNNLFSDINRLSPDKVILRVPDPKILRFLRKKCLQTLPVFADSFDSFGLIRGQIFKFLLSRELKNQHISYIGNHQINASKSLMRLGISAKSIIPYDWPHPDCPENWSKTVPANITSKKLNLFYAGQLKIEKGLQDLINAVKLLLDQGKSIHLNIAGQGNIDFFIAYVNNLKLDSSINFLGSIDHQDVLDHMNRADLVIVPSRHEYPEGLPMTIMESLMVHTPVIVSDHPMFVGRVGIKGGVFFFREKEPEDLVRQICAVISDYELYKQACFATTEEWHALELKLKWGEMIDAWLFDSTQGVFSLHSLNVVARI